MNSFLLNRAQGSIKPLDFHVAQTSRLVRLLEPSPRIRFTCEATTDGSNSEEHALNGGVSGEIVAHKAGVNALAIDRYGGRYMVSGGADPSIRLWDLESRGSELGHLYNPVAVVDRATHESAHTHAITSISIYPFDPTPATVLTTSRDNTLKLSALTPGDIIPAHTFNLHTTPYSHSFSSHPASLLLIAVGTSERSIRLLDLRSGLATHTLPGHDAAVLSVAWAPHKPHILASSSADNRVLVFDVRRAGANSAISALDMDDTTGVVLNIDKNQSSTRQHTSSRHGRAHNGAVTGVRWTSNGSHIITAGQDSRIRVWDATTGANTLVHFGPRLRNSMSSHLAERAPLVLPDTILQSGQETLLWPNFNDQDDRGEILMFEIREGTFVKQLKVPGIMSATRRQQIGKSSALSAGRINALAWRGNGRSGEGLELFSAHGDGTIWTWASRVPGGEPDQEESNELEERKRKRDVLEEIYQGLTGPPLSFT
ncbi:WD repeat protein [Talaromyces proteolyticus]|uniref:WD repeat protein n=1 Tax=Talaromyces proteolyticus TaxID=1131652 RepID=A0AAD4KYB4_9EURO|nr:WD repeat protein [Talaromyces proteolyticus]KAH8700286.1 WD repeat protein [Talaromyces proteolyticus]